MAVYDPLDSENDPFRPPAIPTLVGCLHCGQEYDSYLIEWRIERDADGRSHGFWCCPIDGCDGRGFGCDIFPLDPDYQDEYGDRFYCDDEDEDEDLDEIADDNEEEPESFRSGDEDDEA